MGEKFLCCGNPVRKGHTKECDPSTRAGTGGSNMGARLPRGHKPDHQPIIQAMEDNEVEMDHDTFARFVKAGGKYKCATVRRGTHYLGGVKFPKNWRG